MTGMAVEKDLRLRMNNRFGKYLVSLIIPTFNRIEWVSKCLDSVLEQTYRNVEVIVVDDCSTDGTVEWLASQEKYRSVIVHRQEKNSGASIARNTGVRMAKGELIVFIDSDDILLPRHVETAVTHFEQYPELGLFCCDSTMIDATGKVILNGKTWHESLAEIKALEIRSGFRSLADVFRFSNCFPGFTLRREVFAELGGYDQDIFPADDYDLALRVAASRFRVYYLHEPLCLRREHDGQCSGIENSVNTQKKLIEALKKAVGSSPAVEKDVRLVKSRLAGVEFDLGLSQIKEGQRANGVTTLAQGIAKNPAQVYRIARMIGRKITTRKIDA